MARAVPQHLQQMIRAGYQALLAQTGGRKRRGQQEIVGMAARVVANARKPGEDVMPAQFGVAEGPTGTGKTFAYSLGGIMSALNSDLKVILSVSTVALQEQLVNRDLVTMARLMPTMKVALVKGRSRFACGVRMEQVAAGRGEVAAQAVQFLRRMDAGEWNGELDSLVVAPDQGVWAQMTNDRHGCQGRSCRRFDSCSFYKSRKAIGEANVVVVNHDLLLSDVAAGNVMLPKLSDSVLIVDEAHHLPGKALASLAGGHALTEGHEWVEHARVVMGRVWRADGNGLLGRLASDALDSLSVLSGALLEAQMALEATVGDKPLNDESRPMRFRAGHLPEWLQKAADCCKSASEEVELKTALLLDQLMEMEEDRVGKESRETLVSEMGRAMSRLDRMVCVWRLMAATKVDNAPVAKWLEVKNGDLSVCASPVGVGLYLFEQVWSKVAASLHLSATMRTVGGFAPYLFESGLDHVGEVETLAVSSPFDFEKQASLAVPSEAPSAKDVKAHTAYLVDNIPKALRSLGEGRGALILFASWAQLEEVTAAMPQWVRDRMLSQEDLSRGEILRAHETAIKDGKRSFIFGTAAFEEGVDLRGASCELVYICKLPFGTPTDPVSEALEEHLESCGRNHFAEVVLPRAFRRLAQGVGRLIRSETDTGRVVVADNRLTGTRYGRSMLNQLPPFRLEMSVA